MISETHLMFDGEHCNNYEPYTFYSSGGSPRFLNYICDFLEQHGDDIKKINIALYLFNNEELFKKLKSLANKGVLIRVISIPLEGYDNKKSNSAIIDIEQQTGREICKTCNKVSKYELAKTIYDEAASSIANFELLIYDHVYLRSPYVKKFSRGTAPYSLHIKSFYIEFENKSYSIITSSNLAVRDLVKEELLLSFKNSSSTQDAAKKFFKQLVANSTPINEYNVSNILGKDHFQKPAFAHSQISNFFTAPFYDKSPILAKLYIEKLMSRAKSRIIIVGQHVAEFQSVLIDKLNIDIDILSQTYTDSSAFKDEKNCYVLINGKKKKCRRPSNVEKFIKFVDLFKKFNIGNYFFNETIHLKFIVIDDVAVISTSNFTETQFWFDSEVNIERFKYNPNESYRGTFSEVNQYVFLNNCKEISDQLVEHFKMLIRLKSTVKAI